MRLSASRCSWKGRFPLGSANVRAGEGRSGGARGSAPNTCPCLTDAGKGGVLASPGIHWRKEKADYQLPHPPTLPLSARLLPRLGAGSAPHGGLADLRRG